METVASYRRFMDMQWLYDRKRWRRETFYCLSKTRWQK